MPVAARWRVKLTGPQLSAHWQVDSEAVRVAWAQLEAGWPGPGGVCQWGPLWGARGEPVLDFPGGMPVARYCGLRLATASPGRCQWGRGGNMGRQHGTAGASLKSAAVLAMRAPASESPRGGAVEVHG